MPAQKQPRWGRSLLRGEEFPRARSGVGRDPGCPLLLSVRAEPRGPLTPAPGGRWPWACPSCLHLPGPRPKLTSQRRPMSSWDSPWPHSAWTAALWPLLWLVSCGIQLCVAAFGRHPGDTGDIKARVQGELGLSPAAKGVSTRPARSRVHRCPQVAGAELVESGEARPAPPLSPPSPPQLRTAHKGCPQLWPPRCPPHTSGLGCRWPRYAHWAPLPASPETPT